MREDTAAADAVEFRRHLRIEVRPELGVFLFDEAGVTVLEGGDITGLAPLLDGSRDLAALLRDRPRGMSTERVRELVASLDEAGLITTRRAAGDPAACAYWDARGIDAGQVRERTGAARVGLVTVGQDVDPGPVELAMRLAGLEVVADAAAGTAELSVVLCGDYLDPGLAEVDAVQRAAGLPWLLAKPVGVQVWLGPVFEPSATACWHCLAHRLWGHRRAEACVQATLGHDGPARRPAGTIPPLASAAAHLLAMEVTKWLGGYRYPGQRSVWSLDTFGLNGRLHELHRRPQCPSCGNPSLVADRTARPVELAPSPKASRDGGGHRALTASQVLDRYRHLVSPITGIVKEVAPDPAAPAFVHAYRSGPNLAPGGGGGLAGLRAGMRAQSGGKGASPTDAEAGALCEAVERYCAQYQGDELRVRGSLRSLGAEAVHPNACLLYDERQYAGREQWNRTRGAFRYACAPFDEDAQLDWTPLWSLTTRSRRLLPTAMLYFGTPPEVGGAASLVADSNGNAAGASLADAILQGLLEVIERDAVALWWYNRTRQPAVDLADVGDRWVEEMGEQFRRIDRDLWALDLTADLGVPVTAAVSRHRGPGAERVMLGFGAHLDPRIALRRALSELNQMLPTVLGAQCPLDDPDARRWLAEATVATQPYLLPEEGERARTRADTDLECAEDARDDVDALVRLLADHDLDVLVLDQTRPDIGLPVVKVVVPGMRPFWPRFAPGRLFDVPVRLGRQAGPTPYRRLNPFPMFL